MSLLIITITFLVLLFCSLVLKKSLLFSAAIALAADLMIIGFTSGMSLANGIGVFIHGLLTALEISLLVLGALCFYNYLKAGGFIQKLEQSLEQFSSNKLVIAILLTIYFGYFIEGVSGFGTPAMIIAPLLVGLRFPIYLAAALPLLANTVPVIFGAVGTPVKIGFADLETGQVPFFAAILMLFPALLIPVIFKKILQSDGLLKVGFDNQKAAFITIMAGVSFVVPFIILSSFGPDFPSILAPVIGIAIWLAIIKTTGGSYAAVNKVTLLHFYQTFKPYLFVALLLLMAKLLLGTITFSINWPAIELKKSISLFQPGLIFIAGLLSLYIFEKNKKAFSLPGIFKQTASRIPDTFATIACLAILARLLSQNLDIKALLVSDNITPSLLYVMATGTGFLGSFISGSATVSNLMFGNEWYQAGKEFHLHIPLIMASQLAGAALGNALSVQNIAMVQAVLNEKGLQSSIIQKIWKPLLLFFILSSLSAVVLSYVLQK